MATFLYDNKNNLPLCSGSCHQRHLDKQPPAHPPSRKRIVVHVLRTLNRLVQLSVRVWMQGLKYNHASDRIDPNSLTSMNANDIPINNCLCTLTRKRAVCFQTVRFLSYCNRTLLVYQSASVWVQGLTSCWHNLKMQIRFLSHGSTRSSRSISDMLKYNLAGDTVDPSTLLVKHLHIAHVQELLVAASGKAVGSPPIP